MGVSGPSLLIESTDSMIRAQAVCTKRSFSLPLSLAPGYQARSETDTNYMFINIKHVLTIKFTVPSPVLESSVINVDKIQLHYSLCVWWTLYSSGIDVCLQNVIRISLHAWVKFIYKITSSIVVTRDIKGGMPGSTNVCFVSLSAVGNSTNVLYVSKCINLTGMLGKLTSFAPSWPILCAFRDVVSIQVDFLGDLW